MAYKINLGSVSKPTFSVPKTSSARQNMPVNAKGMKMKGMDSLGNYSKPRKRMTPSQKKKKISGAASTLFGGIGSK